jgi:hypothetical protein
VIENFIGTKSWRKILEGLKRKFGIFIGTKNIFNPSRNITFLCVCDQTLFICVYDYGRMALGWLYKENNFPLAMSIFFNGKDIYI